MNGLGCMTEPWQLLEQAYVGILGCKLHVS